MVIDFFGVPGSGKSTIAKEFEKECIAMEKKTIMYKNPVRGNILTKSALCIKILFLSFLNVKSRSVLMRSMHVLIELFKLNGIRSFKSLPFLIRIIIIYTFCLAQDKESIIIIDQGIYQYLMAAMYGMKYSDRIINDFISDNVLLREEWYVVLCDISSDEAVNRMKSRKNGKSRIERCQQSEWLNKMMIQMKKYEYIKKVCFEKVERSICVSTEKILPDENARIIYERIGL